MSRLHTLFAVVLPSMIAGGVLFASAFGRADAGRSSDQWASGDATIVAQADPWQPRRPVPPVPPVPPTPPTAPTPPVPPVPPTAGSGISVSIHDGKVQIDGLRGMIDGQITGALEAINNSGLPPDVKAKLVTKLEKVRAKLAKRLAHIDVKDLDQLGDEMGKLGDEIGKEMEEFGREMEKYGDQMGKAFEHQFGKRFGGHTGHAGHAGHPGHADDDDDDDDDTTSTIIDTYSNDDGDDDVVSDLGDLSLQGPQRQEIQRLRASSDQQVAAAKRALDQASANLERALENINASDLEIERAIDAVSQQEATIRRARILAWHKARRVLDDAQRRKVEDAARAHHR